MQNESLLWNWELMLPTHELKKNDVNFCSENFTILLYLKNVLTSILIMNQNPCQIEISGYV